MVEASAAKRDGPVVTHVDHIIKIRWNTDMRRWDVRFLRHDEMGMMRFTPAMTVYEVKKEDAPEEDAPEKGGKRKQVALAEKPLAKRPKRRPPRGK
ncbi:hypothetical protein AX14_011387 [Amanita brunnescens Koide BX004]|nr:hypothetical protein AX14_011387 [Amanita brunnescens Koide BX004]